VGQSFKNHPEKPNVMDRLPKLVEAYKVDFEHFVPAFIGSVTPEDLIASGQYTIAAKDSLGFQVSFPVDAASYLAIVDRILRRNGTSPSYVYSTELDNVMLVSLGQKPKELGQEKEVGIIMFLNWAEPGKGTEPLHKVFPTVGDAVILAYVVARKT